MLLKEGEKESWQAWKGLLGPPWHQVFWSVYLPGSPGTTCQIRVSNWTCSIWILLFYLCTKSFLSFETKPLVNNWHHLSNIQIPGQVPRWRKTPSSEGDPQHPDMQWSQNSCTQHFMSTGVLKIQVFKVCRYSRTPLLINLCDFPDMVALYLFVSVRVGSTLSHSNPLHLQFISKNDYSLSHLTNFVLLTISGTNVWNPCHVENNKGCLV